jgi:hypothetical protein
MRAPPVRARAAGAGPLMTGPLMTGPNDSGHEHAVTGQIWSAMASWRRFTGGAG